MGRSAAVSCVAMGIVSLRSLCAITEMTVKMDRMSSTAIFQVLRKTNFHLKTWVHEKISNYLRKSDERFQHHVCFPLKFLTLFQFLPSRLNPHSKGMGVKISSSAQTVAIAFPKPCTVTASLTVLICQMSQRTVVSMRPFRVGLALPSLWILPWFPILI